MRFPPEGPIEQASLLGSRRGSGILLHPTSLPGGLVGDLGEQAHRFVEWLAMAGQACWQILPLVEADEGGSPYNGLSAMAGNPLLIDLEGLVRDGLLQPSEARSPLPTSNRVDYAAAGAWKHDALVTAHQRFMARGSSAMREACEAYHTRNADWLDDYALFRALRRRHGRASWCAWAPDLRRREEAAMRIARRDLADEIARCVFEQFIFDRDWAALREHAHRHGIAIIGDIPIFVSHDSADVWAHQELFRLRPDGQPEMVAGVPPDYFSLTGQRWGNPLFRWDRMREEGYAWWIARFRRVLDWVDLVRVDHFRGFESYWEIPAEEETAVRGIWQPGPGEGFFRSVQARLGELPVIAEDLGLITPAVDALRVALGYPGMRVIQFAFDANPLNPHLPENYPEHTVAYTGTHDNDTIVGWWEKASVEERGAAISRLDPGIESIHRAFLTLLFHSRARLVLAPIQDVLGLGSEARMNVPGTMDGNWVWRLHEGALTEQDAVWLRELTARSARDDGVGSVTLAERG